MNKAALSGLLLLVGVSAVLFYHSSSNESNPPQGFPYKISPKFGEEKANALLNFINKAATLHRTDLEKNMRYIQESMQAAYGDAKITYNVIVQDSSDEESAWPIIFLNYTYASLSNGVCAINPKWSYFVFFREVYIEERPTMGYVPPFGQGKNVNLATINALRESVLENEETGPCKCDLTYSVLRKLSVHEQQFWNGVCHTEPVTSAYVNVIDGQWISAKVQSCYYTIFAY